MTDEEAAEILIERKRTFIAQTQFILHVVDRAFIDRVCEAYDVAIAKLRVNRCRWCGEPAICGDTTCDACLERR
jgi:hypothetical protein